MTISPTGPCTPPTSTGDDLDRHTVLQRHFRDIGRLDVPVAGRHHLLAGRQVGPELEPPHGAGGAHLRHLLVDDAAAGGHPLHIPGADGPLVAHAVAMFHQPFQHVGDGLDAAVRMPGESGQVLVRVGGMEIVQHQEGIELRHLGIAEGALQVDAGPFDGGAALEDLGDAAGGHG